MNDVNVSWGGSGWYGAGWLLEELIVPLFGGDQRKVCKHS